MNSLLQHTKMKNYPFSEPKSSNMSNTLQHINKLHTHIAPSLPQEKLNRNQLQIDQSNHCLPQDLYFPVSDKGEINYMYRFKELLSAGIHCLCLEDKETHLQNLKEFRSTTLSNSSKTVNELFFCHSNACVSAS